MRRLAVLVLFVIASAIALPLIAEENADAGKDWFIGFVEGQLSGPGRQISISGIDGALSSDVSIPEITISDSDGVWLRIENAKLNWDQGALLGGRLQINTLSADKIAYIRPAIPEKSAITPPAPEATPLEIPQLPVAIVLGKLDVPSVTFGEHVFGLGSEIALSGRLELADGSLDTKLDITRKDGPGGTLALALAYQRETRNATIDLTLNEPSNGVIVNLLDMTGKPNLSLRLAGSGPLSALTTDLSLDVADRRALTGKADLRQAEGGLRLNADLYGPVATLVPDTYKSFFGAETRLHAGLLIKDKGGIVLDSLTLGGGELALAASADTTADGFLTLLKLDARIASSDGTLVLLPGGAEKTGIASAGLSIDYAQSEDWTANLAVAGLTTGDLGAEKLTLDVSGAASNLADPVKRRVTFNGDGRITGISAADPQVAEALGSAMGLGVAGLWSPETAFKLVQMRLSGQGFDMALAGTIRDFGFDGDIALTTPSIASFSGLAGRQLGGAIDMRASGTVSLLSGGFDLTLDGTGNDLTFDMAPVDAILAGKTTLGGRIARTETGVAADGFFIGNDQAKIAANGRFSSTDADFRFSVGLNDLGLLADETSGALSATGTAKGTNSRIALAFNAGVASGTLAGHALSEAGLDFTGTLDAGALAGTLSGKGFLDGHRVDLSAGLASKDGVNRLSGLTFTTQGTELTGTLTQDAKGLLSGSFTLDASDITRAAALFMTEAKGAATAFIALMPADGVQAATVSARLKDITLGETRIGSAALDARITDLFGVPAINGTLDGAKIVMSGITVSRMVARASQRDTTTSFSADASLDNGTALQAAGSLAPAGKGYRLVLDKAELTKDNLKASLVSPTSAVIADDVVILEGATLDVGGGRITSSGTAGKALDLTIGLKNVPLGIANAVLPDLGLAGSVNGTLKATGTPAKPEIGFDISAKGVSAASIAEFGVTPLALSAKGQFANETLALTRLNLDGPAGMALSAKGRLPMVGSGGDVAVTGSVPLSLANRLLANRGTQVSGTASIDAHVTGSVAKLAYAGTIGLSGAQVIDPLSSLRLEKVAATARFSNDALVIQTISGTLATGGTISASGSVSLDTKAGMPADLKIKLDRARYADGTLFVATASGQLALKGALMRNPMLSGSLDLDRAEISIPDTFGSDATLLDVTHEAPSAGVKTTLKRIEANSAGGKDGTASSGSLRLDISVSAPNQVFVRGRGLDAELGGTVRLTGPVDAIQPVGGFELIRGRLSILGQRVDFDSGSVTLIGDLNPYVDMIASSPGESITVTITVSGPVSDLSIAFTSSPELPEDEVLSQLIFKRTLGDLSPLQLAKLAAAASELAGGGNNSLVNDLRSAAGLADLDVVTDTEGNTAVKAGAYLQDNVYLSVEAGTGGTSKISIDLDLTDTLKATGSTSNDGESSIGLYYEQDY